jgi:hypothetical protein
LQAVPVQEFELIFVPRFFLAEEAAAESGHAVLRFIGSESDKSVEVESTE